MEWPDSDSLYDEQSTATLSAVTASLEQRAAIPPAERKETLGRYALGDHLGSGASGAVYRANDRERGLPVALKVLHRFAPASLARFKSEFRVASQCSDSSLVSLFELVEEEGVWAIAMELVDGPPLLEHIRPRDLPGQPGRLHEGRLRNAVLNIVSGLSVLHGAGILHRDLKPSNVLVGRDGAVRIADFGLAKLFESSSESLPAGLVAGTPAYMAPEQGLGRALTPAADLYAMGVLLYEALTGERPFHGTPIDLLTEKSRRDAPDPALLARDAPPDLLALATRLLARDPTQRPTLAHVRAVVSRTERQAAVTPTHHEHELVGRQTEIAKLLDAFDIAEKGRPVVAHLVGPSGVGKSALARSLTRQLQETRGATVLSGRCHELESIPYKGFDAIVDALRQVLVTWSPQRLEGALAPSTVEALPMFPVLGDVLPFGRLPTGLGDNERMRRAREAIVTLLRAVSSSAPIVLVVDDAQWGDAGGGGLLESILTASPVCVRMVILVYRDSEAAQSPLLSHLDSLSRVESKYDELTVTLGPLPPHDARTLALNIIGDEVAASRIAKESGGEPFLLEQLALAGVERGSFEATIDDVVLRRAKVHGEDAFRLVEVASVAGAPLPERLLTQVAGTCDARRTINQLVVSSILRRSGSGPRALLYPYHDRIRTSVEAGVSSDRKRALHLRIAELGEADGLLNAASLARHFEDAGDVTRAAAHALRAARAAEEALAFESAAAMYARVLDLSGDEATKQEARCARARALFIAGRCDAAGDAFALAARHAEGPAGRALQRQAVEAFLAFGHIAEALSLLVPLLEAEGMPYPTTPRAVLADFVGTILETRRRTLFRPRTRNPPEPMMATRSDLAWTGKGLTNVAPQQGVILTLLSLCFAIRSGDAFRIARGLSFAACGFTPGLVAPGARYLRWLSDLAERLDDDSLRVLHRIALGGRSLMVGAWEQCVQACFEGVTIAERTPAPTHWEQTIARIFAQTAYEFMGEFTRMEAACRDYLRILRGRGDRIGEVMFISAVGYPLAARHDYEALGEVIDRMQRLMNEWTVPVPFWEAFRLRLECLRALCWGDIRGGLALIRERWPTLKKHRLLDLPMVRYPLISVRTSVLLEAVAAGLVERRWALAEIRRSTRVLARAPRAEGSAAAEIARSALAHLAGRESSRDSHLNQAIRIAAESKMRAVELMARRALALLRGEFSEVARLDSDLRSLGVSEPSAWARFVTPTLGGGKGFSSV